MKRALKKSRKFICFIISLLVLNQLIFYKRETVNFSKKVNFQKLFGLESRQSIVQVPNSVKKRRKLVLIFSNQRSGSSFVGQFFDKAPNTFYLFEPLFPYTRNCDVLTQKRVEVLKQLLNCEFQNLKSEYQEAFKITRHSDQFAKCIENNLCFSERNEQLLKKYDETCQQKQAKYSRKQKCKPFHDSEVLSEICRNSSVVAFKILRICDISTLNALTNDNTIRSNADLKIIHLVRDPRAVMISRLLLPHTDVEPSNFADEAEKLCDRLIKNVMFADKNWKDNIEPFYLRIRLEDLVSEPKKTLQILFDFLGTELSPEVQRWLNDLGQNEEKHVYSPEKLYGFQRSADEVLNAWRRRLTFPMVQKIQLQCTNVFKKLNYLPANEPRELLKKNKKLFV